MNPIRFQLIVCLLCSYNVVKNVGAQTVKYGYDQQQALDPRYTQQPTQIGRQFIQYYNGVLRINNREVPRCFWWDNGKFFVNQNTRNEIVINGKRIPDYFTRLGYQGQPPPCSESSPGYGYEYGSGASSSIISATGICVKIASGLLAWLLGSRFKLM
ncbi:unnamed protein product [Gordionus sp. m RMFG-2023]|uniref:uncharacterized protein LOC135929059 n=1 Tax=Gordionus sp. m RMFG-2023 TaxID=3053472 RepID=UPI0030E38D0F